MISNGYLNADNDDLYNTSCDVCNAKGTSLQCQYCRNCKQKLCETCNSVHCKLQKTKGDQMEACWSVVKQLDEALVTDSFSNKCLSKAVVCQGSEERQPNINNIVDYISDYLGLQVCIVDKLIEIRAPSAELLEIGLNTLRDEDDHSIEVRKQIKNRSIEFTFRNDIGSIVAKLFKEEIDTIGEKYEVMVNANRKTNAVIQLATAGTNKCGNDKSENYLDTAKQVDDVVLKLCCSFDNFSDVNSAINRIIKEVNTLQKVEVNRPKQDEFRMLIYTLIKEQDSKVICHIKKVDNFVKLVMQARNIEMLEKSRQEFLSLFWKECSVCHEESSRPTYLECKHLLCHNCVKMSACYNDGLRCPLCSNVCRQKTPVESLQLKCIQALDESMKRRDTSKVLGIVRVKSNSLRKPQHAAMIPKYILNKWKIRTGGLKRLRSLIENNYGLSVGGSDDNLKIYGKEQEILELAIQSLERMHENGPESGISVRLADKCVEWRLRGDTAKIAYFLFQQELNSLKTKFKTVSLQIFTGTDPFVVDIRCSYSEYMKVKYEVDELENDMRNMFTDESIQPKTFYHNEKVRDYLRNKSRDDQVMCTLSEKNNVNVIIIRGRKKKYVISAKDELSNW